MCSILDLFIKIRPKAAEWMVYVIYFDNAATTFPKPQNVVHAVQEAVIIYGGNPGRSGHSLSMKTAKAIFDTRQKIADFFGCEVENAVFTFNCTHSLNMAIKGILSDGNHVITSSLEHNSVMRPIHELSRRCGVTYDLANVFEEDEDRTVLDFERLINPKTKAIVCTYASNVTGTVLPIKKLGKLCRAYKIKFIVDAAQAAGVLDINVVSDHIDILCCAGHKGLMGVTGTGVMILNNIDGLHTIIEGGTGSLSVNREQPDFYPDRFESGTVNTVGILSLYAGLEFINSRGMDNIYAHELGLCQLLYEELLTIPEVKFYIHNLKKGHKVPVLSFNVDGYNSTEVATYLSDSGFALRAGLHCAPTAHEYLGTKDIGCVRFSPSDFNEAFEVEALVEHIKKIVKSGIV
ncbi:MAG: cysteine desulfurase family protein [Oscillospiraceae bacterium]|nr:cysteine desulfurase family protein [Oscillospiraceae bacterium]